MSSREMLSRLLGSIGGLASVFGLADRAVGGGDRSVTLLEKPRCRRKVREGICTEEKSIQMQFISTGEHDVQLNILIYESDESEDSQATLGGVLPRVAPISMLRAIEVLEHVPVLSRDTVEQVFEAVSGDAVARKELTNRGVEPAKLDAIIRAKPAGLSDLLHALRRNEIDFDEVSLINEARNGILSGDELDAFGIETPKAYDERQHRKAEATKPYATHFKKWLRHAGLDVDGVKALRLYANDALDRGVEESAQVVGIAAFLFSIAGGEYCQVDLSTADLRAIISQQQGTLRQICDFLAVRFGGEFKTASEYQRELADLIGKWDILQTAAERETADA